LIHPPAATAQPVAPDKLDQALGPIALYPDALVLQILESSTNPDEVKRLGDWMKKNPDLKGTAAQDAAVAEGFGPSYVALLMFPQVVTQMADQPDRTKALGEAFTADRKGVFASIQRLRTQAQSVGNLQTSEHQKVETVTTNSGDQVIVIQPSNPEVVYVPQYNPQVVYTQPPPPPPPGAPPGTGLLAFTGGVILGAAIADNNNDCWGYSGGMNEDNYNNYTEHRENMANQRGENQANRQQGRTERQGNRQESSSANQAQRQQNRASGGGASASGQSAGGARASGASSRGSGQGAAASARQRTGANSGALGGYQSGTKEREASARGRSSAASRSAPSRGGGGGGRGGGGGGGRRGR
jgi:hypothetical protein